MQQDQIIRIYTNTGAGFGNQAANANLLRRIANMGFKGEFEFIYPQAVREKIQVLFNLPQNIPAVYQSDNGILFYTLEAHLQRYINCTLPRVLLAMTGAWDKDFIPRSDETTVLAPEMYHSMRHFDLEKYAEMERINFNFANLMNAEVFIQFSAWQVNEKNDHFSDTIFHLRDRIDSITQANSGNKFLVVPKNTIADAQQFLESVHGDDLLSERPALPALISAYQNKSIKIMSCYGYTLTNFHSPNNLIEMMAGARYAQVRSENDPIIIVYFGDLDPLALMEIYSTLNFAPSLSARRELENLHLNSVVTINSISESSAIQNIQHMNRGQILLLSTGNLPQLVFNSIYTYSAENILLQVREGTNAFVSLLPTGRPHLRCGGPWELGFEGIEDYRLLKHLSDASLVCGEKDEAWDLVDVPGIIGEYILDAQNPESSLSQYFKMLSLKSQNRSNDRVLYGLTGGVGLFSARSAFTQSYQLPHCRTAGPEGEVLPDLDPTTLLFMNMITIPLTIILFLLVGRNNKVKSNRTYVEKFHFLGKNIKEKIEYVNDWTLNSLLQI